MILRHGHYKKSKNDGSYDLAYNAEMENIKIFEFDSNELRAAVDVINSMGAAMPAECRDYL